jgi:ribonuclease HII
MIHVGIDEAGYGPTLGPLVVSAAAVRVPDAVQDAHGPNVDFWELLSDAVHRKPQSLRVPVNDSKKLYKSGKGLGTLEEGVLPFLLLRDGKIPATLRELLAAVMRKRGADSYLDHYPWYRDRNREIPTGSYKNYLSTLAERLQDGFDAHGMKFLGVVSVPVEVLQFNDILTSQQNKSLVTFEAIGSLLRRVWKTYASEPAEVVVDRQGGRIQYGPLLYQKLRPRGVVIECQTAEKSVYRLRDRKGTERMTITFTKEGDSKSFLVALASMTSKYLRELHMGLFNDYWREHKSELKPTAGYPNDARRFLDEIAELRGRLGTEDRMLIRRR